MSISNERQEYIKKLHKDNFIVMLSRLLIIVIFIAGWEILARLDIINTFTFSSPSRIIETIVALYNQNNLFPHIWVTLYETLISFLLATGIGLGIAILLWYSPFVSRIVDPYLTILNSLPKVALGPLIIIWVGASVRSIIFMSLLISTFITIINIYNGFVSTNEGYITLMKSFKASKWQIFTKVIFPSNYATIVSSLKVNISMNLIGVIMGELLVSKEGIGYLIMYGSQVFNIDLVIAGVFVLGIISYLMYWVVNKLESRILKN